MAWKEIETDKDIPRKDGNKEKQKFWDRQEPLEGVLALVRTKLPPNGSTLYALENEMGERTYFWGSLVLDDKMSNVSPGMVVRIEPQGRVQSRGSPYRYWEYRVLVRTAPDNDNAEPELSEDEKEADDMFFGRKDNEEV